jgi:ubiquinone/menaquinone biosynthesis C-methylase UbiE
MFEVAEAYEASMGRWSRQLAPLFVEFAGVRDGETILDVGCGTGSLTRALASATKAAKIVGVDPSKGFIDYARTQVSDPRVSFEEGDAQALPYPDGSFDRSLALLIVNFIPDAPKAAREMRRVTKKSGFVATTFWDGGGANKLNSCFWDAAVAVDTSLKLPIQRPGSYGSAEALVELWKRAGVYDIELGELTMPCRFSSFDELWQRYIGDPGSGPSSSYAAKLSEGHREAIRQKLREFVLQRDADGPFSLQAKAWAVKGSVP